MGRVRIGGLRGGAVGHDPVTPDRAGAARYPIRAVSKLTGIAIDTLRAWERRYGAVVPVRDGRGRLYSDADVARLRLLHDATLAGHAVGRIATLPLEDLRALTAAPAAPRAEARAPVIETAVLRRALDELDGVALDREFSRLAAVLPPLELVRDLLLPTLREVGEAWNQRRGGIAHERLISSSMRHLLGSFLRVHARSDSPIGLMFATPSGERHEVGILSAAMLAASRGLKVSYVGPDLPAAEIVAAARASGVRVLVLGLTTAGQAAAARRELAAIADGLPEDIELWVGGPAAAGVARAAGGRAIVIDSFDAYLGELTRLGQGGA